MADPDIECVQPTLHNGKPPPRSGISTTSDSSYDAVSTTQLQGNTSASLRSSRPVEGEERGAEALPHATDITASTGHREAPHPDPPLPSGTKPLANQVAGHMHGKGKTRLGFLQCNDGTLLKPVQCPTRGERELRFYQQVFQDHANDPMLLRLQAFMPKYLGLWQTEEAPGVEYLKMEDITKIYNKPCIADIKIGAITYGPDATPEKIASEKSKYPALKDVGYQILGMRVYSTSAEQYKYYDKVYGRTLSVDTVVSKGLGTFFTTDDGLKRDAVGDIVKQLEHINDWFLSQRELSFYSSSLLLVYEGKPNEKRRLLNETSKTDCCTETKSNVKMIDFAHVFPTSEMDENYIFGIDKLIYNMHSLLKGCDT